MDGIKKIKKANDDKNRSTDSGVTKRLACKHKKKISGEIIYEKDKKDECVSRCAEYISQDAEGDYG